jgi:hypothetical protein
MGPVFSSAFVGFASTWVLRARRSASTELADLSAKSAV